MKLRGIRLEGEWTSDEIRELGRLLSPLPPAWVEKNPHLKTIIRRSVLTNAPPEAPGHSKYEPTVGAIVVFDKGVYDGPEIDPEQFRRSIYHELAHSLIQGDPELLNRWAASTNGDGFVDDYAKTSPDEDFADTFSECFISPGRTAKSVPQKSAFVRELVEQANQSREKVAMTFITAFADELTKTAASGGGALKKMMDMWSKRTPGKIGVGKGLLAAGGTGATTYAIGSGKGKQEGYEEGAGDLNAVAQRAHVLGIRRGALMMRQHMMRQQGGEAE